MWVNPGSEFNVNIPCSSWIPIWAHRHGWSWSGWEKRRKVWFLTSVFASLPDSVDICWCILVGNWHLERQLATLCARRMKRILEPDFWHSRPLKCSRRTSKWYRTKRKKKKVDVQMFGIPVVNSSASSKQDNEDAATCLRHFRNSWTLQASSFKQSWGEGFMTGFDAVKACFVLHSHRSAQRQRVGSESCFSELPTTQPWMLPRLVKVVTYWYCREWV